MTEAVELPVSEPLVDDAAPAVEPVAPRAPDATADAAAEAGPTPVPPAPAAEGAQTSGAEVRPPEQGGWVRLDTDNVIRGWTTDRNNRDVRFTVEVSIDGAPVAAVKADQFDPKLAELGEGDGAYAFAVLLPSRYCDGAEHTLSAVAVEAEWTLKCKKPAFSISEYATDPLVEVLEVGPREARCRLTGGQYFKSVALELWVDGVRQAEAIASSRLKAQDEFAVSYELEALASWAGKTAVVAAPGMIEAGLPGAELFGDAGLKVSAQPDGRIAVAPAGLLLIPEDIETELHIRELGDELAEPYVASVSFAPDAGPVALPPELLGRAIGVQLACEGVALPQFSGRASAFGERLAFNGSFHRWSAGGPIGWSSGLAAEQVQRGYFPFDRPMAEAEGLTGDTVVLKLPAERPEDVVLLRQLVPLPARAMPEDILAPLAVLLRVSGRAALTLRLVRPSTGRELSTQLLPTGYHDDWQLLELETPLATDVSGALALELMAHADPYAPETIVEVAGIRLGDLAGFHDGLGAGAGAARAGTKQGPDANLLRNAALTRWPDGVALSVSRERMETAEGWYVFNRRTPAPVLATATPIEDDPASGFGLTLAADKVTDGCRLEAALDGAVISGADGVRLGFEASCGAAARRLWGPGKGALPEFLLIERIMLVRRAAVAAETGLDLVDSTEAVLARKVLITRSMERFEFFAPLPAATEAAGASEYYLAFEFRQPFAITLQRPRLTAVSAETKPEPQTAAPLALEDRVIAAQAGVTRGLESWISPDVARPIAAEPAAAAAPVERWSWGVTGGQGVEVAVCAHNAADETLACLASLLGTSRAPHTVRIIDDASDPDAAARIAGFVADKPWMQVVRNDQNRGYTASANRALKESEADWVVLLSRDAAVTGGWIEGMLECAASDPAIAMVGPVSNAAGFQSVPELDDAEGEWRFNLLPAGWTPARMAALVRGASDKAFPEVPLLSGFCALMRRSAVLEAGGFNETAFLKGGEANDLCLRLAKAGHKLAVADHVYVHHAGSPASAGRSTLTKAEEKALKAQHPEVNYAALSARLREVPALVKLRAAVRDALSAGAKA